MGENPDLDLVDTAHRGQSHPLPMAGGPRGPGGANGVGCACVASRVNDAWGPLVSGGGKTKGTKGLPFGAQGIRTRAGSLRARDASHWAGLLLLIGNGCVGF